MPSKQTKPLIFISYAHADEPERLSDGDVKWLSFVTEFLRCAVKRGAVDIWIDRLMRGGDDWDADIESKLRECDIFVLLVSRHSTSSDYIVDKAIAIIRERQKKSNDVHFYPLLLTPTPTAGLEIVRDRNLRPRGAKPFSSYSLSDRLQHMAEAADEIAEIAAEIAGRKNRLVAATPDLGPPAPTAEITGGGTIAVWLKSKGGGLAPPVLSLVGKNKADQKAAIIFVHGFSGSGGTIWNSVAPRVAGIVGSAIGTAGP